jgi:hypothetical protein
MKVVLFIMLIVVNIFHSIASVDFASNTLIKQKVR